jgi:hypothetical protein
MGISSRAEARPIAEPRRTSGRPRILLAEREKEIRDILVPWLFKNGFDCREAENGRDAIDLLAGDSGSTLYFPACS